MKTRLFLFSVMMAALTGQKVQAQVVQMATVQHGETMSAYYGVEALKDAVAAAAKGDIISLSAGQFNAPTINKAVTIQGAGYVIATGNYTAIVGETTVNVPNGEEGLLVEGLHCIGKFTVEGDSLCSFIFRKCRMGELLFTAKIVGGEVSQSKVNTLTYADANNFYVHHDVIHSLYGTDNSSQIAVDIDHCVFTLLLYSNVTAVVRNSVIHLAMGSASCAFYNNVAGQDSYSGYNPHRYITSPYVSGNTLFSWSGYDWNYANGSYKALFANPAHANTWNETYDYKLTEEAAAQYIGSDGTQVGIYGGSVPFSETLSTPQIVEKQIATQTDENGMLSVKIKVEAQK
ncbi:MAG: hypothetical protein IJT98_04090 [Prevotella sp.]|nr:hypothetical protein [Prevotella sp.]